MSYEVCPSPLDYDGWMNIWHHGDGMFNKFGWMRHPNWLMDFSLTWDSFTWTKYILSWKIKMKDS